MLSPWVNITRGYPSNHAEKISPFLLSQHILLLKLYPKRAQQRASPGMAIVHVTVYPLAKAEGTCPSPLGASSVWVWGIQIKLAFLGKEVMVIEAPVADRHGAEKRKASRVPFLFWSKIFGCSCNPNCDFHCKSRKSGGTLVLLLPSRCVLR